MVLSSVALADPHGNHSYGGRQLIWRQTTGPLQAICWLHWP
ncbi:MAG TPA: hypothetical protein VF005_07700 [Acidimicrobiales bacterium]